MSMGLHTVRVKRGKSDSRGKLAVQVWQRAMIVQK
jgi:hypothetical protein